MRYQRLLVSVAGGVAGVGVLTASAFAVGGVAHSSSSQPAAPKLTVSTAAAVVAAVKPQATVAPVTAPLADATSAINAATTAAVNAATSVVNSAAKVAKLSARFG